MMNKKEEIVDIFCKNLCDYEGDFNSYRYFDNHLLETLTDIRNELSLNYSDISVVDLDYILEITLRSTIESDFIFCITRTDLLSYKYTKRIKYIEQLLKD